MTAATRLIARRRPFASIPAETWDALVAATPAATPFSRHCVQQAWWNAYGATAHDQTLEIVEVADAARPAPDAARPAPGAAPDAARPAAGAAPVAPAALGSALAPAGATTGAERLVGIAPLMHRHELEPGDLAARTTLRHAESPPLRPVPDSATAVFFGASYHADYATILAAPSDLAAVCEAVADALAAEPQDRWDVVDLRRLRIGDPATDALAKSFEWAAPRAGWLVTRELEEVCPVVAIEPGIDYETYLGTLGKKERHEIRRKVRRAEEAGPVELTSSTNPAADLEAFIDLHQKRWGADGLFPPTEGGAASRRFFAGLFEDCGPAGVDLSFLTVDGRRIAAGVTFDDGNAVYYYNAGVDPDARELSPGVVMVARYFQRAIELGRTRLDFLRGNEPYKYEWGAVDAPVERLLIQRTSLVQRTSLPAEAK